MYTIAREQQNCMQSKIIREKFSFSTSGTSLERKLIKIIDICSFDNKKIQQAKVIILIRLGLDAVLFLQFQELHLMFRQ